jgi:hypothetical protein
MGLFHTVSRPNLPQVGRKMAFLVCRLRKSQNYFSQGPLSQRNSLPRGLGSKTFKMLLISATLLHSAGPVLGARGTREYRLTGASF